MATLVLSAVGTLLGGPIGGAIGAIIGQQVDQAIFAPKGRQGPRLSDLSAQSSSYGSKIPKLFGANRVAGTVIWATDLKESSSTSGGKGSPKVTNYSYSASFAVVLSARPIGSVGRIWADGNLLRGAAGDFKVQTGFRLYRGTEDQPVDPLIASAEGSAQSPAYRGLAYAVFEDLLLDSFGRRVPSLSFEVFADDGNVSLAQIITSLSGAGVAADCPTRFGGYAASGDSVRGAVETLTAVVPVRVQDDGAVLKLSEQGGGALLLDRNMLGATTGSRKTEKLATARQSASTITQTLGLAYYDVARDYQQGMQRARRDGGLRKEDRLNLPVTLESASARALVEARLDTHWAERVTAKIVLPWRYLALRPGDDVLIPGNASVWRISALKFNRMVLECNLVRTARALDVPRAADAGRIVAQSDAPAGPTTLILLDLPQLTDGVAEQPIIMVAAAGASTGWRAAVLSQSVDDGASWQPTGQTAQPAIIGHAITVLGGGSSCLVDRINSVDIQLLNDEMLLADANETLLLSGRNIALLGGELVQFGRATPLGGGVWRLSHLWRGRRGTDDQIATHKVGDGFTLITAETLARVNVAAGTAKLLVTAQGVGDVGVLPEAAALVPSFALRPPSPVHLMAKRERSGDTLISWVRRSRDGWRWVDGVDAPLAEEAEIYSLTLTPSVGAPRIVRVTTPEWRYTADARTIDGAAGASSVQIEVTQIGTMRTSLKATQILELT